MSTIKPGLVGRATLRIGEEHTAPQIGSGRVHVMARPVMINLMETAALDAAEHLLPAGRIMGKLPFLWLPWRRGAMDCQGKPVNDAS